MASLAAPQPLFLINTSPSEPKGLYVRSPLSPDVGRLVAFHVPPAGRAYVAAHMPQIGKGGVLKALVGGPGSQLCADDGVLRLDGRALGPIHARDRAGRALPQWRGCRMLRPGEYAVFSGRITNSLDSRYYGPVRDADLIGVFEPLWVAK